MLQGRCDYLLIDDFDYEITEGFLRKYGFNKEEIELVWGYLGGKPVYLVKAVKNRHRLKEFCEEMLRVRINQIRFLLNDMKRSRYDIQLEDVINALGIFKGRDELEFYEINDAIEFLIKENILFFDPLKGIPKPQSKLDLLAIRRILKASS